ncbi:restriction endonuclease subunit S [Gilliamella sp. wkB112]|uniref:restriction endonuclease subunit S n=1 Tax=Gilliamella sp. wkB112 TaxID=3120257 RepID=UPI00080EA5D3|nr:restriction endonuclease subunit S [Gilliamella apicola]OCG05263.1 hypothetical protein A9G12_05925 [Gilliamella apicola]
MNTKKIVKFGDICQEVKLTTKDPISDGFEYYIGLEHLDSNSLTIKRWGIIRDDNPSFTRVFKKGHILFGKRRSYLKKAAIAKFDGICSSDIIVMEPIGDIVLHELVPYIIQSEPFWDFAIRTSSGSLSPRTKWKDLATYTFNISEQQGHLLKLFQTMEKTLVASNNLLDACQQKKKVLMQNLLTGKVRLLNQNGCRFNHKWKVLPLSYFVNCIRGVSYKPNDICLVERKDTVRMFRSTNIQNGLLNDQELIILPGNLVKEKQLLIDDDLVVCMANGSKSLVGKAAQYVNNGNKYTVGSFCAIFRPNNHNNKKFLKFLFESSEYSKQLLVILAGSSINNLKGSNIENMEFYVPIKYEEQHQIANILTQVDEEITIIKNKIKSLENIKRNILLTSFN